MASTAKVISLASIFFSIIVGLLIYYWISPSNKEEMKIQFEKVVNFLLNFIIFMWIAKVVLNITIFIKDPLAVLAYPADSTAFYLAIIASFTRLVFKQKNLNLFNFLSVLLPVVLTASFMFEFTQFIQDHNWYSLTNMIVFMILVTFFYYFIDKISPLNLYLILLISWLTGTLIMYFTQPYVSFFGYLLSLPFIFSFFLFNLSVLIYHKLKR
ncbi:hypothetical protein ACH0B5_03420 [Ureibacillus sp. 179-F W5.1 NHS]|uniref:Uncharacterized protein n=1 Tax=Lysinibacillus halotolerans TaxID=1368476 RepID=A0A3M8H7R0_9BACI|nr:hypothetical protein [Lysinibacillus halotolerans]RNC98492.1 hypothetical protein EC501_10995 [Lysinibacillus halotolerans]